jgi:hypothetical protein
VTQVRIQSQLEVTGDPRECMVYIRVEAEGEAGVCVDQCLECPYTFNIVVAVSDTPVCAASILEKYVFAPSFSPPALVDNLPTNKEQAAFAECLLLKPM